MSDVQFCAVNPEKKIMEKYLNEPACMNCGTRKILNAAWEKHKPFCKMKCGYEWAKGNATEYKWCYICGWYERNEQLVCTHTTHEVLG